MTIKKNLLVTWTLLFIFCISSLTTNVMADIGIGEGVLNSNNISSAGQSLSQVVNEYGQIYLSVDALGILGSAGSIQVEKKEGATVRKAYLLSATTGFSNYQLESGDVRLHDTSVVWDSEIESSIYSYNYWADVTAIVKPIIDFSPTGLVDIQIYENNSYNIDGEILAVIFDQPSQTTNNSILLYFGSQNIEGDKFNINFGSPIDKSDQNLSIDFSLGISYGYQTTSTINQYSIVDVNGERLTTSAGGQDDGEDSNGALITVGGIGDQKSNPQDPYSAPVSGARSDDEVYNLIDYVNDGDTSVTIQTENPSFDDNILFAAVCLGATRNVAAIDIDISYYKSYPSVEERAIYENIMNYFADGIYESSNGAHRLGHVTFHPSGTYLEFADIVWKESCHPNANVAGIATDGLHINMCDIFTDGGTFGDYDFLKDNNHQRQAGYALAHEWGHYYYALYDEYVGSAQNNNIIFQPHSDDEPVENSIMNRSWNAYHWLLGDEFEWLNFSVSKNFTQKNAQNRVYGAPAWDTLVRPISEDPRDGERISLPERIYYPELIEVQPDNGQDSPIELPGNARDGLIVSWMLIDPPIIASEETNSVTEFAFESQLSSLTGSNISYPTPIQLLAFVHKDAMITDLNIEGTIQTPGGSIIDIDLTDDGIAPDDEKGDGLYSAIFSPEESGIYAIVTNFNNNDGNAKYVFSSFAPAIGENGPVPLPDPIPVDENFELSETIWISVSNVVMDDFGNTPLEAMQILADNKPTTGKINYGGDKDVFEVTTLPEGITYVRVTNLALGMNPIVRVIDTDGTTVLFSESLETSFGSYVYVPLLNIKPDRKLFVEVADISNLVKGGLYDISVGHRVASDVPNCSIFLPKIIR